MKFIKSAAHKRAWDEGRQKVTPARVASGKMAAKLANELRWGPPADDLITDRGALAGTRFGVCACSAFEPLLWQDRAPFACCDCRAERVEQVIVARDREAA